MGPDNGTENVETKGSLFIVDPNPPGRDMIPPEDMFIYVKFTATPRSRFIYGGLNSSGEVDRIESGVEDEVSFISTKIKYNSEGTLDPNPQNTYATTSWTNIGGLGPTESRGVLEGFGIKSIDIKYNASLVPVVDITFTDVRGAGLFDTIKDKERLSPYSVFFKMPYPVFNLSVKGYFGQSIDYCLHMVNWTSNFDGTTGNFDITANFLGFQQAFLNDMNIGNIIGTVNTQRGFNNLNKIFDEQDANAEQQIGNDGTISNSATLTQIKQKEGTNIRKIDDFFTKIAKLQIDTEVLKAEGDELDKLKQINGQLSLLKSIRSFIGSPIPKTSDSDNNGVISEEEKDQPSYLYKYNNKNTIITSKINDNVLKRGENYLSIRDYLLINSTQQTDFKRYMETLYGVINDYSEYISKSDLKTGGESFSQNEDMISSFNLNDDIKTYWLNFIINKKGDKPEPKKLSLVLDEMSIKNNTLNLKKTYPSGVGVNRFFNMDSFTAKTNSEAFYSKNTGLSKDSNVLVVDFREQRERVQGVIEELTIVAKEEREKVQKKLNDKITENFQNELGFRPTVDNCFRIIANNTQAMTSTIYDITKEATKRENKDSRREALLNFQTDVPTDITDPIAWPLVFTNNDDGTLEEIYIGDEEKSGISDAKSIFPEVNFVEEVFTNLIAKTKSLEQTSRASVLKNGLDTDNWFPINPIDYKINPWIGFSTKNSNPDMDNFIAENLFKRVAVLKNYSNWDQNNNIRTIDKFASLDGIAANKAIITPDIRNIYKNKLEKLKNNINDILDTSFGSNLEVDGNDFIYNADTPTSISGINIGGTNQKEVDYILFDVKGIVANSKRLPSEILENSRYTNIKKLNSDGDFYKEEYRNSNINLKVAYNVWDPSVSKGLDGKLNGPNYYTFKIDSLSTIDLTGTTSPDGKFLNRTNFSSDTSCPFSQFLIQSDFYENQKNIYAKAILLLSTLPFKTFKEAVLDVAFPNGKYENAKIINLPKYYIYFIGGYLWKSKVDGQINWDQKFNQNPGPPATECTYSIFSSPYNCYLTNVGYLATTNKKGSSTPLEPELLNLPNETKELFIKKFKNWANSPSFSSFEFDMKTYKSNTYVNPSSITASASDIKRQLSDTTNMIVLAPGVFKKGSIPKNLKVSKSDILKYINSFLITYQNLENDTENIPETNPESEVSSNKTTNKIKLQIYNYFKNINDKWVSDTEKTFNVCGGSGGDLSLYDYFKFIDRGWNDIGNEATVNLSSFLTLGSNLQTSVYFFMAKLLRDSNFLFQILPTYVDFTEPSEVSKMFKPVTTIKNNASSGPIYCCIYVGGASQALDIGEKSTYAFANDGFTLDDPPADISNAGGNSLVAFRVGFGAENQTIFKNVSLSQQEHKETGEYFKALSELVDKRGGTQKVYQGTDLLRLFKTRSYTCKVDALGCMNIQPLMYFNLENVPFFNGAYLITSVNHNISPNHMTTNFQGVRQSKYISKPNTEILADLNLDLNETNDIPKLDFKNLKSTDPLWKIGVLEPQEPFNFDKWTVDNFKEMGVDFKYVAGVSNSSESQIQTKLDTVRGIMESEGIITNSQVCMFVANVMSQSTYLLTNKTSWSEEGDSIEQIVFDNSTIYSGKTRYYGVNNPPPVDNPFYGELVGQTDTTILGSTPTFSSGTENNVAYKSVDPILYEEDTKYNYEKQRIKDALENETDTTKRDKIIKSAESEISGLTYYNIYPGDGWRFKQRGYLYITGRREYFEYSNNWEGSYGFNLALNQPYIIEKDIVDSFQVAVYNWKFKKPKDQKVLKKYKNSYEVAGGDGTDKKRLGSSSDFALTNTISCEGVTIQEAYNTFESVLLAFDLKDDNNP
jgi:predicted chitinase